MLLRKEPFNEYFQSNILSGSEVIGERAAKLKKRSVAVIVPRRQFRFYDILFMIQRKLLRENICGMFDRGGRLFTAEILARRKPQKVFGKLL